MFSLATVFVDLNVLFLWLFCDFNFACWVEPIFRLCFVIDLVGLPVPRVLYNLAASSTLITTGVIPVRVHRASLDAVRKALAILMLIILCTLMYFSLLYSNLITSAHTGAP